MTLLEAVLATIILSVVAIACLEGSGGAAALQRRAAVTSDGVAVAEAAMAQAVAGSPVDAREARVTRVPYVQDGRVSALERVDVEVPMTSGGVVRLSRLVPRRDLGAARLGGAR